MLGADSSGPARRRNGPTAARSAARAIRVRLSTGTGTPTTRASFAPPAKYRRHSRQGPALIRSGEILPGVLVLECAPLRHKLARAVLLPPQSWIPLAAACCT